MVFMELTEDEAMELATARHRKRDEKVAAWRLSVLTAQLETPSGNTKGELREWSQLDPGSRSRWRKSFDRHEQVRDA